MFRSVFSKSVERCSVTLFIPRRTVKYELPIKWERPEEVKYYRPEKAGDLKPLKEIDIKNTYLPLFEKSKEFQTADDKVKRLFSLEFQPRPVIINALKQNYVDSVKQHEMDTTSLEAVIAAKTASIRYLQKCIETFPVGKKLPRSVRVQIHALVSQRAKCLKALREQDYKLFEWLLERLDLFHKPRPANGIERVERKKSLRRLTDIYCETLRQERLDQYREQLELQHDEFLEKKVETLQWIQSKEKEFNLKTTVTDEEIESVVKQLEEVRSQKKTPTEE